MPPFDYKGNTNKSKEQQLEAPDKKIEKVITGEVIQKKKPLGRRMKEIFFGGDFKSASRYVAAEVLLPALRNLVVDGSTKAVERLIYGDTAVNRRRPTEYRSYVQYSNPIIRRDPYTNLPDQPRYYSGSGMQRTTRRDTNQLVVSMRRDAELVLERMVDILDKYEVVSVADLNELIGNPITPVDNKWGWISLNNVEIRQIREGYLIDLPLAEPI